MWALAGSMFRFWCPVPVQVRTHTQTYRETYRGEVWRRRKHTREQCTQVLIINNPNYGSTECRHINNHLLFPTPPPTNRNPKLDLTTFWCPTPTLLPPPGFSTTDRSLLYSAEACPSPIRRGHEHSSACRGIQGLGFIARGLGQMTMKITLKAQLQSLTSPVPVTHLLCTGHSPPKCPIPRNRADQTFNIQHCIISHLPVYLLLPHVQAPHAADPSVHICRQALELHNLTHLGLTHHQERGSVYLVGQGILLRCVDSAIPQLTW